MSKAKSEIVAIIPASFRMTSSGFISFPQRAEILSSTFFSISVFFLIVQFTFMIFRRETNWNSISVRSTFSDTTDWNFCDEKSVKIDRRNYGIRSGIVRGETELSVPQLFSSFFILFLHHGTRSPHCTCSQLRWSIREFAVTDKKNNNIRVIILQDYILGWKRTFDV